MNDTPMLQPGAHSCARVAYRASREEVDVMLAQGHSIRTVYEHLKAQGRAPCSYSAFCDYVRGQGQRKHSRKKKPLTRPAAQQAQPFRQTPPAQSVTSTTPPERSRFLKPSDVDPKTIF